MEKLQKIFDKLNYKILFDVNEEEKLQRILHFSKGNFEKVLKYRKPKSLTQLHEMLLEVEACGRSRGLERYKAVYGDKGEELFYEHIKSRKLTLETMIERYGIEEGTKRFDIYRQKQAYSNSLEYKREKYGWDEEEFKKYNLSRAVTLKNMQKKYGFVEGEKRFESYCDKQAFTNTFEYLGDRYYEINKQKAMTLDNFQRKYGIEEGLIKYETYIQNTKTSYSKISQKLFFQLIEKEPFLTYKCHFAEHNNEFGIMDTTQRRYYKFDFICNDLKFGIEFNGDHFHGNPEIYSPDAKLRGRGVTNLTAKEAWERDKIKIEMAKRERNIDVITIWEKDYRDNEAEVIQRILEHVGTKFH